MAIRVDDIVVTERNVLLLSEDGHQLVADIEKNTDASDSGNYTRDRNPWNFYSSDGHIYHNLFDTADFDIRTQVLTGSNRHSPNNGRSHETIFMPHDATYRGICQFYGNSYTITDFTTSTLSSDVNVGDGVDVFGCDHGFVRYDNPSAYDNSSEYYISPVSKYNPISGVQYITEYPLNGFYMDFGDNESDGRPTLFGDSVLSKYYLDQNYSVSSYEIDDNTSRFRQIRTYYDIGSTGNSIYMVFRNNLNGISFPEDSEYIEGGTHTGDGDAIEWDDNRDVYVKDGDEYSLVDKSTSVPSDGVVYYVLKKRFYGDFETTCSVGYFPASSIGYMSNMVTLLDTNATHETSGLFYSSNPYSDMFGYVQMTEITSGLEGIYHPSDNSFILYVQTISESENVSAKFTYIPKIGLERSSYTLTLHEDFKKMDFVELEHCVVVGTANHGILSIWSRDYLYSGKNTLVDFDPFQYACSGMPSADSLTSTIDGDTYKNVKLFYNGSDILCARVTVSNELSSYEDDSGNKHEGAQVAFFSTNYSDGAKRYEIGQFFMPAGNPLYEIETLTSDTPITTKTLSSVPVSSLSQATGAVVWNFQMEYVDVVTGFESITSDPFQVSANYVYDSDILFDYSSTVVENELEIGSYAFVQFEKYGLAKCHVDDIYSQDRMVKFSSTGPVNRYDSRPRTWNEVKYPDSDQYPNEGNKPWKVRSKANTFDDLLRFDPTSYGESPLVSGDILSLVEPHVEEKRDIEGYSYFVYTVDGNLSSWVQSSVPFINGNVVGRDELLNLSPSDGDRYFMTANGSYRYKDYKNVSSEGYTAISPYGFYQYVVEGNLSSWENITDSNVISGHVDSYDDLPGVAANYETPIASGSPFEGAVVMVYNEKQFEQAERPEYQFYVYDIDSLKYSLNGEDKQYFTTYAKRWKPFSVSDYISSNDVKDRYIGAVTLDQMKTDGVIRNATIRQNYAILVNGGDYDGITVTTGTFYKYVGSEQSDTIDGWVYNNDKISFNAPSSNSEYYYSYDFTKLKYRGYVETYEQLLHMSPPQAGSIYFVLGHHYESKKTYPKYTFFRFGYDGNVLDWWQYDYLSKLRATVESYGDLKRISPVSQGDICSVAESTYVKEDFFEGNQFYRFSIDGNSSRWVHEEQIDGIIGSGYVVTYGNLLTLENPSIGDVCVVGSEMTFHEVNTDANSFYSFEIIGNSSRWTPVELSASPYSLKMSGYAESYSDIENLSGTLGSVYFTESETEPLKFYMLETNDDVKVCTDATFSVISYGDDSKKPILEAIDYIAADYSTYYVTGKPGLKATFTSPDGKRYTNSFSDFPFTEREGIKEPIFSTTKSLSTEIEPVDVFSYALEKPVESSMGVSVKTFKERSVNHDAAISLVKWNNSSGEYYRVAEDVTPGGLHLQYNGICTDVYMNGTVMSSTDGKNGTVYPYYSSTIYEYPHPCYGDLKTAGTGLPIFEGPLGEDMEMDDMFFVNGYFVVKNYSVDVWAGKTDDEWNAIDDKILGSGKHPNHDTGNYPKGGYVVTNFFADTGDGSGIPFLYKSTLVESSKETPKTKVDSERFYDYNYLWHISPESPIEFYPESVEGKSWLPYYPSKYVDFIRYHNGYYYISLRSERAHGENTVGYDIVETDTLFGEKPLTVLEEGVIVSDIRFFDSHVAVEYEKRMAESGQEPTYERYIKWFECGKSGYKVMPMMYSESHAPSPDVMKKFNLDTTENYSTDVAARYDNVEVINSLNRFTPVVNHKSNLFSIRVDDLGFEESEYLTDYQKKVLRTYFRNSITDIVNAVKPAHTQLFDVYLG